MTEPPCLTPEEINLDTAYGKLWSESGEGIRFGATRADWQGMSPMQWFHANHARFLLPLDAITATRKPFDWWVGPDGEGVYFLFDGEQLQYVGQSVQISTRLHKHGYPVPNCQERVDWLTHYTAIWVPKLLLDSVESYYLHMLRPPRNQRYLEPHRHIRQYLR